MLDFRSAASLALLALVGFLPGCASIINGTSQPVSVVTKLKDSSQDVMGAQCTLTSSKGEWYVRTPGTVVVHRGYGDMAVVCSHPNYTGTASIKSSTKPMAFGNIIFGGVIGAGIDMGNGSAYDYLDMIVVPMTPVAAAGAPPISATMPTSAPAAATPAAAPPVPSAPVPAGAAAAPPAASARVVAALKGGQDGFQAERLAKAQSCSQEPRADLVATGPGFEAYSVTCTNGDAMSIRCEFGNCRVLR